MRDQLFFVLAKRSLLALDLSGAEEIIARMQDTVQILKLQGGIHFLQGRPDEAVQTFAKGLREIHNKQGLKKLIFTDECGLIHALSLLKLQDQSYA